MKVEKYRELPYSASFLKELVCDIDTYKQFVPHCHDSRIVEYRADGTVCGALTIKFGPFMREIVTCNRFDESGQKLILSLEKGPVVDFDGYWLFEELSEDSTRVSFYVEFSFKSGFFDKPFEHAVGYLYSHIIDSFAQEAKRRHRLRSSW